MNDRRTQAAETLTDARKSALEALERKAEAAAEEAACRLWRFRLAKEELADAEEEATRTKARAETARDAWTEAVAALCDP